MSASTVTRGQLERNLTQRIQGFYFDQFGRRPEKVICQFFDEKLAIAVEKMVSPAERLLIENQRYDYARELRSQLDIYIKPRLHKLIEEIIETSIIVLLIDTDLDTEISGIIAVLASSPPVRDPDTIPKVKKEKLANLNNE
jgi:uncharacterized protein YbcI